MEQRIIGYARVSSSDQNLACQLIELERYISRENIVVDKGNGKFIVLDSSNTQIQMSEVKTGGLFHFPLIKKQLKSTDSFPDYRAKSRWYR